MNRILFLVVRVAIMGAVAPGVFAQGTAFTYQGHLLDGTTPANGLYDFQFTVWSAPSGPSQIGSTLSVDKVGVSNGVFVVALDFGAGTFTGPARWLEIAVSTNGGGSFTSLEPRQPLTAPPASGAGNAEATIPSRVLSVDSSSAEIRRMSNGVAARAGTPQRFPNDRNRR